MTRPTLTELTLGYVILTDLTMIDLAETYLTCRASHWLVGGLLHELHNRPSQCLVGGLLHLLHRHLWSPAYCTYCTYCTPLHCGRNPAVWSAAYCNYCTYCASLHWSAAVFLLAHYVLIPLPHSGWPALGCDNGWH